MHLKTKTNHDSKNIMTKKEHGGIKMNAFGWFEAKIRIYTDTKEALELLQLLEKRFQETEQKWAEGNSEGDLFAGFRKDEQPDYTEYEMDSNYTQLAFQLGNQLYEDLKKVDTLNNGSFAFETSSHDYGYNYAVYGAAKYQEISLAEFGKGEWVTDQNFFIHLTMKLKTWMALFDEKKEEVLPDLSWADEDLFYDIFDEKFAKAMDVGNISVMDVTYFKNGKPYFLHLSDGKVYPAGEETCVPDQEHFYCEEDEIHLKLSAACRHLTNERVLQLRESFYENLEALKQYQEDVKLLMSFYYFDQKKSDALYQNEMIGSRYSVLRFDTGMNRFDVPTVLVPVMEQ